MRELAESCIGGHKWVLMNITKKADTSPAYQIRFVQLSQFFCEKCLETKDVVRQEYSRETPQWFKE